ncbi:MAG: SAM-dependent methyltransferase, partial [Pseudomonadota bacterium]
ASAAAASIGQPLTRRGQNSAVRLLTAHDMKGYAEADWRGLTAPGAVAAIYMGKKAARFLQGRMLMFGADRQTPVTVVENASQPNQRILPTTLIGLPDVTDGLEGPAIMLLGLAPRAAADALTQLTEDFA